MSRESQDEIIQKYRDVYHKIEKVVCPAFSEQVIYFNRHGLNHLIRKKRKLRKFEDQIRRLRLLPHVVTILAQTEHVTSHKKVVSGSNVIDFWKISKDHIHIILRRTNNGLVHFFSVF
jgi:hypothetical protein